MSQCIINRGYRAFLLALVAVAVSVIQPSGAYSASSSLPQSQKKLIPSFTLKAYWPGSLTQNCRSQLVLARKLGFGAVAFSPSFAYDHKSQVILDPALTVRPGEIQKCLDEAWKLGFNIIYQPHLDALALLKQQDSTLWRGDFSVQPDSKYETVLFGEFKKWLVSKKKEVLAASQRHVDVMLSAELEKSVSEQPGKWNAFYERTRNFLKSEKLDSRVRLSFNVNWGPRRDPSDCAAFAKLVQSVDFIGVSFYGDFSKIELGPELFVKRMNEFRQDLGQGPEGQKCHFDASKVPVSIAEFGVGGEFKRSQDNVRAPAASHFQEDRRALYRNLFSWATDAGPLYLNFWTIGVFDAFGLYESGGGDPEIRRLLSQYVHSGRPPAKESPLARSPADQ